MNSGKKNVGQNWYLIPILDTLINWVNTLGGHQPILLTFIDKHDRLIEEVETPVVGANSDEGEVETPGVDYEL